MDMTEMDITIITILLNVFIQWIDIAAQRNIDGNVLARTLRLSLLTWHHPLHGFP